MWATLGYIAVGLVVVLLVAVQLLRPKPLKHIPIICQPHFLLGNLPQLNQHFDHLYDYMLDNAKRIGGTFHYILPLHAPVIYVISPENVEHILSTNFDNYVKGQTFHDWFEELLGDGIFNVDGKLWQYQRDAAKNMFNHHIINLDMMPIFNEQAQVLTKVIADMKAEQQFDIQDLFYRFTLDAMTQVSMGLKLGTLRKPNAFAKAFDDSQQQIVMRSFMPGVWRLWRLLNVGGEKILKASVAEVSKFAYHCVANRRSLKRDERRRFPDLISRFITEAEEGENQDALKPADLSDKFLRDIAMNFILAGRDTTAIAATWLIYRLCKSPEAEQKCVDEIRRHLGDSEPTGDKCRDMKYLEACILEALRLNPSVPADVKHAVKADVLPDGTQVPEGALMVYLPFIMGRLPNLWSDPEEFRPERWLTQGSGDGGSLEIIKVSPYLYPVFNAGPRTCLGKQVAILEVKVMMAVLLRRFHFKLVHEVRYNVSIMMPVKDGLFVTASPRV